MRLSEINPIEPLKALLTERGVAQAIYANNKPTANLPSEFINIYQNGGTRTRMSQAGMVRGFVLIAICVRLMASGSRNTTRENAILSTFDELFSEGKSVTKDGYTYRLEANNMVFSGGGIFEGYSTKMVNISFYRE